MTGSVANSAFRWRFRTSTLARRLPPKLSRVLHSGICPRGPRAMPSNRRRTAQLVPPPLVPVLGDAPAIGASPCPPTPGDHTWKEQFRASDDREWVDVDRAQQKSERKAGQPLGLARNILGKWPPKSWFKGSLRGRRIRKFLQKLDRSPYQKVGLL
jgi:hypothetical protein